MDNSIISDKLGNLIEGPKAHLLHALIKELTYLIESDILPRWTKNTEMLDAFLNSVPHPSKVLVPT
jgi:hypothetical protein